MTAMPRSGARQAPTLLVLRALGLGDLLVAVPALRGLRAAFPDHRFVLACSDVLRPLVEQVGGIDQLLPVTDVSAGPGEWVARLAPVDVAVNLHGNGEQSRRWLDAFSPARRIGHRAPRWAGPRWREGVHERVRWTGVLRAQGWVADPLDLRMTPPEVLAASAGPRAMRPARSIAVVHVGASQVSRHWPVDRFAEVAAALVSRGMDVVVTGDGHQRARALAVRDAAEGGGRSVGVGALRTAARGEVRVVAGEQSLTEFCALIGAAELVVTADTGAGHLASAFGTPSVVLFGPATPQAWGPPPGPHWVLTDPGVRHGDPFADVPDPALLAVGAREVIAALGVMLD